MIEQQQYPIGSVPKYNFSLSRNGGLGVPHGFVETCLGSLNALRDSRNCENLAEKSEPLTESDALVFSLEALSLEAIPLHAVKEEVTVVAVDVSSMRVGETEEGIIIAVRGAIVWNTRCAYRFLRLGPFLFHVTEENKSHVFSALSKCAENFSIKIPAFDSFHLQTSIAIVLERLLQLNLCMTNSGSLILLDGSLIGGTVDAPEEVVRMLLRTARERENSILAFSKFSRLRLNGRSMIDVICKRNPPYMVKIASVAEPHAGSVTFMGDVYVVRLSENAVSFRLDIDRQLPQQQAVNAVEKLLGNDLFHQGYPETLRLAHIYSTFTANEVIGIKHYLTRECGLSLIIRPNLRRILFGPFGKGPEG
ncbi:MAG: DNA double-strand break repair nuclease NurA [Candidatus Bathyarchaeales archaeon]